jgi:hypothetical protein
MVTILEALGVMGFADQLAFRPAGMPDTESATGEANPYSELD